MIQKYLALMKIKKEAINDCSVQNVLKTLPDISMKVMSYPELSYSVPKKTLLLNVMLAATYIYQTYHVYRVNKHIFTETLPCRLVQ